MTLEPVIECADLSFTYGFGPVLNEVSVTIERGEFLCVVGPNGGGKTTFLRLLLGLLRPTTGTVRVFGQQPAAVRSRIGYVPQHARLDPAFPINVREVVLMGRLGITASFGGYCQADYHAVDEALVLVGMEDLAERPFATLSGGQRQRVLLARGLASEPDLLLLDEPTSNIDAEGSGHIYDLLGSMAHERTILMVSHDLGFVSTAVKSVLCIRTTASIHPVASLSGDLLRDIYGFDVNLIRHDHRCSKEGHTCCSS